MIWILLRLSQFHQRGQSDFRGVRFWQEVERRSCHPTFGMGLGKMSNERGSLQAGLNEQEGGLPPAEEGSIGQAFTFESSILQTGACNQYPWKVITRCCQPAQVSRAQAVTGPHSSLRAKIDNT